MSLKIKSPGLLSSIQDLGRWGYQKEGVLVNGAMDSLALRIGNVLVDNSEGLAALEITHPGPEILFERDHLIVITGADLSPAINRQAIKLWRPLWVKAGSLLRFGAPRQGRFSYLSVAGGFDVPEVMGSRSTYLRGGFGGYQGRALAAGDLLYCGKASAAANLMMHKLQEKYPASSYHQSPWFSAHSLWPAHKKDPLIRIIEGPEYAFLSPSSIDALLKEAFEVSLQSDRMAYRLKGPVLSLETATEMISSAVSLGTLQLPSDGQPLLLLADRQTTGGYPRIAQVVTADLPKVAQMLPGSSIRFIPTSLQEAQQLYIAQEKSLYQLKQGLHFKFKEPA